MNTRCGRKILLVDDSADGRRALARFLEHKGFAVTSVGDGSSALEALASEPPPDFLLTDLQLPDIDGLEIVARARKLSPRPRVALITGWSLDADPNNPGRWDVDWIFLKPLDVHGLLSILEDAVLPQDGVGD